MKYCLLSDIHSNLPALEAVLSACEKYNIDEYICLGDIVGYGPFPNECIKIVKDISLTVCAGNHDFAAVGKLEKDDFNKYARIAIDWTEDALSLESKQYLKNELVLKNKIEDFEIVHGGLTRPLTDYIINKWIAVSNFKLMESPVCFFGHTHIQRIFCLNNCNSTPEIMNLQLDEKVPLDFQNNRYLINPGSIGQPRDRNRWSAFCIFDTADNTVIFKRAEYDLKKVQNEMKKLRFPDYLINRLNYGK